MKTDNPLELNKRHHGMTVPDGYFSDFASRMAASLPQQPWEMTEATQAAAPRRSMWQIVRPYVYMAAMFAGVWCMMNIFDHIRPASTDLSIDSSPVLTAALSDKDFVNEYIIDDMDEADVYDVAWEYHSGN